MYFVFIGTVQLLPSSSFVVYSLYIYIYIYIYMYVY